MLKRILGEEVRDKHGKYGNEEKYEKRKCKRERKYMGEKKVEACGEVRWREGPGAGMLNRILGGEVRDKTGSTEN